jgi:hypothetical protein
MKFNAPEFFKKHKSLLEFAFRGPYLFEKPTKYEDTIPKDRIRYFKPRRK